MGLNLKIYIFVIGALIEFFCHRVFICTESSLFCTVIVVLLHSFSTVIVVLLHSFSSMLSQEVSQSSFFFKVRAIYFFFYLFTLFSTENLTQGTDRFNGQVKFFYRNLEGFEISIKPSLLCNHVFLRVTLFSQVNLLLTHVQFSVKKNIC